MPEILENFWSSKSLKIWQNLPFWRLSLISFSRIRFLSYTTHILGEGSLLSYVHIEVFILQFFSILVPSRIVKILRVLKTPPPPTVIVDQTPQQYQGYLGILMDLPHEWYCIWTLKSLTSCSKKILSFWKSKYGFRGRDVNCYTRIWPDQLQCQPLYHLGLLTFWIMSQVFH